MQKTVAPKKSWGFISVVMLFSFIIGVGYFLPSFVPASAANNEDSEHTSANTSKETETQTDESIFTTIEKEVASTTNEVLENIFGFSQKDTNTKKEENAELTTQTSWKTQDKSFLELVNGKSLPSSPYTDIEETPFKESILVMYSNQLFQESSTFQPKNYVRISDFIRVVVDTYRLKKGQNPSTLEGLTEKNYFSNSEFPIGVTRRINSAYELWLLQNIDLWILESDSNLKQFITPKQAKEILLLLNKKVPELVRYPENFTFQSNEVLYKEELAELFVQAFQLELDTHFLPTFNDISWTTYQKAIQILADQWIVSGQDGNFYPYANVENKDFVVMIIKSLIAKQKSPISIDNFYYLTNLKNVSTGSFYAPYLEYCLDSQVCNSLLSQESSWVSFQADKLLTWEEIGDVLSNITKNNIKFPTDRNEKPMTRGELAHLLVGTFGLDTEEENTLLLWQTEYSNTTLSMNNLWIQENTQNNNFWDTIKDFMKVS